MRKSNLLTLLALLVTTVGLQAQFDDLYYTEPAETAVSDNNYYADDAEYDDAEYGAYDDAEYEDYGEYDYYSEYDNYYSSRIRRFSRPAGTNYYNSYYANDFAYDPFYSYYSPSYVTFDRFGRGYYSTVNRVARPGSFISINFGTPFNFYNRYRNPYGIGNRYNRFNRGGWNSGPFGLGYSSFAGGFAGNGCPIGGYNTRVAAFPTSTYNSTRAAYPSSRTTRRTTSSSTRRSTGYRNTTSTTRPQTYSNRRSTSSTAQRAKSRNTPTTTRSTSTPSRTRSTSAPSRTRSTSTPSRTRSTSTPSRTRSTSTRSSSTRSFRSTSPSRSTTRSSSRPSTTRSSSRSSSSRSSSRSGRRG